MLTEVADGVLVHESEFMKSNAVVVQGDAGVLLVDVGIRADEIAGLADELRARGLAVAVGFSTHPHWDHLLWHPDLGSPPRYGTAPAAAAIAARLAGDDWRAFVTGMLPAELVEHVLIDDTFGRIDGLPEHAERIPWEGPAVRILEHRAHAPGHAALLIEEAGVLVAGDMLSDVLVPMLNPMAPDPIADYLAALDTLEGAARGAGTVIPGHGSVGGADDLRGRIDRDRAYLHALRESREPDDARLGSSARPGWEWVQELHAGQVERLAQRG